MGGGSWNCLKFEAEEKIAALATRCAQLLDLISQQSNRLLQTGDREVVGVAPINRGSRTWKEQLFSYMRKLLTILSTPIKNDVLWSTEKIDPGQP
ncbi:MAG: hypothetical protein U1A77_09080 [Pirellulales bacterium]